MTISARGALPAKTGAGFVSLKKNLDFKRVYRGGKSAANDALVLYMRRNGLLFSRFGFSVSKKVGKAVVRNKIRRRLKEALRTMLVAGWPENGKIFPPETGCDFIVIVRKPAADASFWELKGGLESLLKRLLRQRPTAL